MERTYINEAQKAIGGTVKVQGFIENLRNSKYMAFIVLKDITGKLQITVEKEDHPDLVDTIDHASIGEKKIAMPIRAAVVRIRKR